MIAFEGLEQTGQEACTLARGAEARRLLADPVFLTAWQELRALCPWSTAFQSPEFTGTWYRIYDEIYEPVIISRRGGDGGLDGLLALAVSHGEGQWVVAGAAQAEYQAWLARPGDGADFIEQALDLLFARTAIDRLQFLYLPSAVPTTWIGANGWRDRVRLTRWHRPLMAVADKEALSRSLAKKGNRSRLKRLERLGALRLEEVTDPARLAEVIDRIADLCDFRHGAAHNLLPFRQDSRKAGFHLALLETPGLLDVSLLWAGGRLVAGHMGLRDGQILYNGILTHSPFEARHSPGKLHLMLLARRLAEEGFRFFDLTPGNDPWKDRFASDSETVSELVLHRRAQGARRENCGLWAKRILNTLIRAAGFESSRLRRKVAALSSAGLPGLLTRLSSRRRYRLYAGSGQALEAAPGQTELCFDNLAHLSNHAAGHAKIRLSDFLARSLQRIEQGQTVCSVVAGNELAFLVWILPVGSSLPRSPKSPALEIPKDCAVIEIEAAHPADFQKGLLGSWIRQTLRHAKFVLGAESLLVKVPVDAGLADRELCALGLTKAGDGEDHKLLGLDRTWVSLTPLNSSSPVASSPLGEAGAMVAESIGEGPGS